MYTSFWTPPNNTLQVICFLYIFLKHVHCLFLTTFTEPVRGFVNPHQFRILKVIFIIDFFLMNKTSCYQYRKKQFPDFFV